MSQRFLAASQILPLHEGDYEDIAEKIAPRLQRDEALPDVLAAGAHMAVRRAALLDRPATREDVTFSLAVLTWWPYKPKVPAQVERTLLGHRAEYVSGLAQASGVDWHSLPLSELIPDSTLTLSESELYERHQHGVESFLNIPLPA